MKKWIRFSSLLFLIVFALAVPNVMAQCAMCRATVENNFNNGDTTGLASSLNIGILYLLCMPYISFAVLAILWFRVSTRLAPKKVEKYYAS